MMATTLFEVISLAAAGASIKNNRGGRRGFLMAITPLVLVFLFFPLSVSI